MKRQTSKGLQHTSQNTTDSETKTQPKTRDEHSYSSCTLNILFFNKISNLRTKEWTKQTYTLRIFRKPKYLLLYWHFFLFQFRLGSLHNFHLSECGFQDNKLQIFPKWCPNGWKNSFFTISIQMTKSRSIPVTFCILPSFTSISKNLSCFILSDGLVQEKYYDLIML